MLLLTKELEQLFKKTGTQMENSDPLMIAKFFNPCGIGTWYASEYDEETRIFFGFVSLLENEWGYFSLDELVNTVLPFGLRIERDKFFTPCKFSEIEKN